MAASSRPGNRRAGPSGAWQRLKPAVIDPLEVYGLPSKGEMRLNDFKVQEQYYNKIVERYMKFCATTGAGAGGADELERCFAAMKLEPEPLVARTDFKKTEDTDATTTKAPTSTAELSLILSAMRKLRESITSAHRTDNFAQRSYIFIVHACVLTSSWESYHPALLYLLSTIHPVTPLSSPELAEFLGYRVLDLACREGALASAIALKVRHKSVLKDRRIQRILEALVRGDWCAFWRAKRAVDGYQRRLVEFAEGRMRLHALKCLGRSYLTVERKFVEDTTRSTWAELMKEGVGWELIKSEEGKPDSVVIRRPKVR